MKSRSSCLSACLGASRFVACMLIAAMGLTPSQAQAEASEGVAAAHESVAADQRVFQPSQEASYGARFMVMLAGNVGYSIPTGDWFEGSTSGFMGGGSLRISLADNVYIGFAYNRQWLGVEKSAGELLDYYFDESSIDTHLDEFFAVFGWMSPASTYSSPFAYMELGIGGIKHVASVKAREGETVISVETDEMKLGGVMAIGGIFPFTKEIGLNIEGDMRLTGQGGKDYGQLGSSAASYGFLFGFKIGLVALLGSGYSGQ